MAELLTLATPEIPPTTTTWSIEDIYLSVVTPSIKVTLVSNAGDRFVYRVTPTDPVVEAQIRAGLSFINQGKFMTVQGKSLQKWLLDKISADGVKVGTVSGTVD